MTAGALECFRARKESTLCKKGKACRDQAGEMRLETAGPQQEHLLGSRLVGASLSCHKEGMKVLLGQSYGL